MNQRALQKIKTRKKIYESAIRLFMEKSFDEVRISDIVEEAGISTGTFYYHFPGKEDIIDEGYRDFDHELQKSYEKEKPADGIETILFLTEQQVLDVLGKGVRMTTIFFKNQLGIQHNYYFNESRFLYQKLLENVVLIVADHTKGKQITDGILRIIRGIIYDWCLHKGEYDLKATASADLEIYLKYYEIL